MYHSSFGGSNVHSESYRSCYNSFATNRSYREFNFHEMQQEIWIFVANSISSVVTFHADSHLWFVHFGFISFRLFSIRFIRYFILLFHRGVKFAFVESLARASIFICSREREIVSFRRKRFCIGKKRKERRRNFVATFENENGLPKAERCNNSRVILQILLGYFSSKLTWI